jgi:hypothetical protein
MPFKRHGITTTLLQTRSDERKKVSGTSLGRVQQKYNSRLDWMRFAACWNAEFTKAGLGTASPVYAICQALEARLGIDQGTVSPPAYRAVLADLIAGRFGSRHEFCQATVVDPEQLSRFFAGRADLSLRALQKVLEVFQARLIIQTEEQAREQTSVAGAQEALAVVSR